ncbi:MAG: hypothetical protein PHW77_08400 [Eubacteriales bacterium]|nr:hypothetical protein [Eubacteriales bacterium]
MKSKKILAISIVFIHVFLLLCSCQETTVGDESTYSMNSSSEINASFVTGAEQSLEDESSEPDVTSEEPSQPEESLPEDGEYMTVKEADDGNCLLVSRNKADGETQYAALYGGKIIYELEPGITVDDVLIIKPSEVYEFKWKTNTGNYDFVIFDKTGQSLIPAGTFDSSSFIHTDTKRFSYGLLRYKESKHWVICDLYCNIISEEFENLDQYDETFFLGTDLNQNGVRVLINKETDEVTVSDYDLEKEISDHGEEVFKPVTDFLTSVKNDDRENILEILDEKLYNEITALLETVDKDANPENLRGNNLAAWLILNHEKINGVPSKAHEWLYIGAEEGLYSQFDFYVGAEGDSYLILITACVVSEGNGKYKFCWIY